MTAADGTTVVQWQTVATLKETITEEPCHADLHLHHPRRSPGHPCWPIAQVINATGQIVGYYTASVNFHGFLLSGGTYTTLDDPLTTSFTEAFGINASGQIVGYPGFLLSGNSYTTLSVPGPVSSALSSS